MMKIRCQNVVCDFRSYERVRVIRKLFQIFQSRQSHIFDTMPYRDITDIPIERDVTWLHIAWLSILDSDMNVTAKVDLF